MKKTIIISLSLVFIALVFFTCKKETKEEDLVNGRPCGSYEFYNQTLSGKIAGRSWTMAHGVFQPSPTDTGKFVIDIYEKKYADSCSHHAGTRLVASIQNVAGLYPFGPFQSVTLHDSVSNGDFIAFCGGIQILTIDTAAGKLTGKMDARVDERNYLYGNFTLSWCR